jgi:hypothetical protein
MSGLRTPVKCADCQQVFVFDWLMKHHFPCPNKAAFAAVGAVSGAPLDGTAAVASAGEPLNKARAGANNELHEGMGAGADDTPGFGTHGTAHARSRVAFSRATPLPVIPDDESSLARVCRLCTEFTSKFHLSSSAATAVWTLIVTIVSFAVVSLWGWGVGVCYFLIYIFYLQSLPAKMPVLASFGMPKLAPKRQIMCPHCNTLYDGSSKLATPTGELVLCPATIIDPRVGGLRPCGAALGEWYRGIAGKRSVRPRLTVARLEIAVALRALWQRADFAEAVINEDTTRPSSFKRTKYFAEFARKHPALAASRGLIHWTLYMDYFTTAKQPLCAKKAQVGSIYLRPTNLPPHLAKKSEYNLHIAVLTGAAGLEAKTVSTTSTYQVLQGPKRAVSCCPCYEALCRS